MALSQDNKSETRTVTTNTQYTRNAVSDVLIQKFEVIAVRFQRLLIERKGSFFLIWTEESIWSFQVVVDPSITGTTIQSFRARCWNISMLAASACPWI